MARLSLPDPKTDASTSLRDAADAESWVAAQAQAQPMRLLRAALSEIEGIDASAISPLQRVDMLDVLRRPVVLAEAGLEMRYANKPLPLVEEEGKAFDTAWRVWHALGIAYLRTSPFLSPADALRPLHRASIALREALHCHYIAGQESPPDLLELLYQLLLTAENLGVERTPVNDVEYKHLGESSIVADIAWSFLLHFCDPYRFSAAQFNVANRALSRWRELAGFQNRPDDSSKAREVALAPWLGENVVTDDGPKYLDVRPVVRKIRRRIEALEAGETPEQLRLGRELAAPACIKLLRMIDDSLRPNACFTGDALPASATQVALILGNEHMFEAIAGVPLEETQVTSKSDRISHERIALFGFDNMATRTDHAVKTEIPSEVWGVEDGWILRAANAGAQILGPALVAIRGDEDTPAQLAVLVSLRQSVEGWLMATLRRLPGPPTVGIQRISNVPIKGVPRTPVFLLPEDSEAKLPASICVPTGSGARAGSLMALDKSNVEHLRLTDVIERGTNFVRFGYVKT